MQALALHKSRAAKFAKREENKTSCITSECVLSLENVAHLPPLLLSAFLHFGNAACTSPQRAETETGCYLTKQVYSVTVQQNELATTTTQLIDQYRRSSDVTCSWPAYARREQVSPFVSVSWSSRRDRQVHTSLRLALSSR